MLFLLLFLTDIILGSVNITLNDFYLAIFSPENANPIIINIIHDFRFPKAVTAILAGIALSVSGLQMQTVFRNPLAGPYILGISSGAGLGVAMVLLGLSGFAGTMFYNIFGGWVMIIAACCGAGMALVLVMIASSRVKDIMTVLIIGILIGAISSAIINILQYFSDAASLKSYVLWSFGSLGKTSGKDLIILFISVISGLVISLTQLKNMDALLLGEDYAQTLGVSVQRTRKLIFLSTAILAGSITAFCGPIAFIGIITPHIARTLLNTSKHFTIFLAVILLGSIIMLITDIISHVPGSNIILPLNAINSLLGIPVVLWMVLSNSKISSGF